ncbi:PHT4 [Scenedesmus sp. PABB004]|nr:PHT4 [Scenedesmus sp. PABB004]
MKAPALAALLLLAGVASAAAARELKGRNSPYWAQVWGVGACPGVVGFGPSRAFALPSHGLVAGSVQFLNRGPNPFYLSGAGFHVGARGGLPPLKGALRCPAQVIPPGGALSCGFVAPTPAPLAYNTLQPYFTPTNAPSACLCAAPLPVAPLLAPAARVGGGGPATSLAASSAVARAGPATGLSDALAQAFGGAPGFAQALTKAQTLSGGDAAGFANAVAEACFGPARAEAVTTASALGAGRAAANAKGLARSWGGPALSTASATAAAALGAAAANSHAAASAAGGAASAANKAAAAGKFGAAATGSASAAALGGPALAQSGSAATAGCGPASASNTAGALSNTAALAAGSALATTGCGPAAARSSSGAVVTGGAGPALATDSAKAAGSTADARSAASAVNGGVGPAVAESNAVAAGKWESAASSSANAVAANGPAIARSSAAREPHDLAEAQRHGDAQQQGAVPQRAAEQRAERGRHRGGGSGAVRSGVVRSGVVRRIASAAAGPRGGRAQPPLLAAAPPRRRRPGVAARAAAAAGDASPASSGDAAWFTRVVLPLALVLLVCNMDRICLSVAILPMAQEFGWSASKQGLIQSAFLWGYTATQLLGGHLADRYGGRAVIAAGVLWFSIASLLLPAALSPGMAAAGLTLPAVLLARMCVGLGEGVALPSMSSMVSRHVPPPAKARALGMAFSGFHSGNLVGLAVSPLILVAFGWKALFLTFGLLGGPLVALWLALTPRADEAPPAQPPTPAPSQPSQPSQPAGAPGGAGGGGDAPVSMGRLLSHPATWAIIIVNVVNHWGYFIYLNWMPSYFSRALGFDLRASSFLSLVPWLVMAVGSSAAGFLADGLLARGVHVTTVRKALQSVSMLVPAAALGVLADPGISPGAAVTAMTAALGVTSLGQAGFVANMSDIAPRQAGQMFGLCNTFGCLSGIAGVLSVGLIVEATGSFVPVFQITAAMYVAAVAAWNLLCTGERVF